jgi:putative transposase
MHSPFRHYRVRRGGQLAVVAEEFETEWGNRYRALGQAWRSGLAIRRAVLRIRPGIRNDELTPPRARSLHPSVRKSSDPGSFRDDDARSSCSTLRTSCAGNRWATAMFQFAMWVLLDPGKIETILPATLLFGPQK